MSPLKTYLFILFSLTISNLYPPGIYEKTEVVKTGDGFQLLRNGQPYYVLGAGGDTHLKELADIGGNSIRTWATGNGLAV